MNIYYILIILNLSVFLLSSCQSPKYLKVDKLVNNNEVLPEVQYYLQKNFNPNNINCIAIGKLVDNSNEKEFKSLDKLNLVRQTIYGHLSPKNYEDIELHKVKFILKSDSDINTILKKLDCDAIIEGEILQFQNNFYITYSSTNVGLKLFLKNNNDTILWKATHVASSRAGNLPFSPIGLATGIFSAGKNTDEEVAFQMLDTVVRRLLKTLPERTNVNFKNQMKFSNAPNIKEVKLNQNKLSLKANKFFKDGEYRKSIELINDILKSKPSKHELIFLKARAQLMLNKYEKASSSLLDALALKLDYNYLNGLGFTYAKLNNYDKALAAYTKAIKLNNKNSYAYFNSALILESKGRFKRSGDYFYYSGASALINKEFTRANKSLDALKRLSKINKEIGLKKQKLDDLIKDFPDDDEKNYTIKKINSNIKKK